MIVVITLFVLVALTMFVLATYGVVAVTRLLYLGSQTLQPARSAGASQPTVLL